MQWVSLNLSCKWYPENHLGHSAARDEGHRSSLLGHILPCVREMWEVGRVS
jgi:hypothetical protein